MPPSKQVGAPILSLAMEFCPTKKALPAFGFGVCIFERSVWSKTLNSTHTVRIILIDPDDSLFITGDNGHSIVGEEQVCTGHRNSIYVFC